MSPSFPPQFRTALPGPAWQAGFTFLELLVVLAVFSTVLGITALNVRDLHNGAESGVNVLKGSFSEARTRAISTTSAVRAQVEAGAVSLSTAPACTSAAEEWDTLPAPQLPERVTVSAPLGWVSCWTSRGRLSSVPQGRLTLRDERGRVRTLSFYLTGTVVSP